ncbi:iron ABC transporter permease [Geodermatophilus sp. YIM 151500]|uniref:FecCD family ABC transporter permease n=1 Tax=Geodermatophilus sp. YIM 151500 TaxID=2984531 RepID=UPI0021E4A298|nr:iron ABC transporter permease [Geodermatophilus sp. YIM 151500]MCV2491611.1 iron ABC transporter permease [Geodermatophilus sp. YIM 151500]
MTRTAAADAPAGRVPQRTARPARRRVRLLVGLLGLLVLAVVVGVLGIAVGARSIAPVDVWTALVAPTGTDDDVVVRALRLPRTALGLAVGAALGLAGALIQGHTRNPLADPGLLGVSAGAAFAVCLAVYAFGVSSVTGSVWFALAGALLASVVVFLLGTSGGGGSPVTLALAGAAVTAFLTALTSGLVLLDSVTLDAYRFWVVGSLVGRGDDVLAQVAPFLLVGLLLALVNAPALDTLQMGEDVARGLGQRIGPARLTGVAAITLLTGAAVAVTGPIAFVGLVVPHVARAITGPAHRWLLPYSGLLGAVLLVGADVVGRVLVRPAELPVGLVLAVVGAPFFIALVRRRRLVSL